MAMPPVAVQSVFVHLVALSAFSGCRPSLLYNIMYRHLLPNVAFSLLPDAFLFCLLPPNYRLPGTNYGLVGPNYRLPAPNENESCLLAVLFALQALLFRVLGVVRRGGEGKVVD